MVASGTTTEELATTLVAEARERRERIPGFGHPRFRRIDPRAQRLREIAEASGLWGDRARLYAAVHRAFTGLPGKADIPINDVGMMAVVLVELGFTPEETTGLAVLSTMPGVVAHISEELRTGRPIRVVPEAMVDYGDGAEHDFATDRRSAGWPDGS
jgi:citrate synthase